MDDIAEESAGKAADEVAVGADEYALTVAGRAAIGQNTNVARVDEERIDAGTDTDSGSESDHSDRPDPAAGRSIANESEAARAAACPANELAVEIHLRRCILELDAGADVTRRSRAIDVEGTGDRRKLALRSGKRESPRDAELDAVQTWMRIRLLDRGAQAAVAERGGADPISGVHVVVVERVIDRERRGCGGGRKQYRCEQYQEYRCEDSRAHEKCPWPKGASSGSTAGPPFIAIRQ